MNNRQGGGRRRGRNNNAGGQRPQGGGRGDSGNRIDSRARGNAAQLLEKYRNMARDAQMAGDRVMTEYHLQFADHYFRVLSDTRARAEEQRARYEGTSEGESDAMVAGTEDEAEDLDELDAIDMIGRAPRNRGGSAQGNGYDRQQGRDQNRDGRMQGDRAQGDRQHGDRQRDGNRERPREEHRRDDRPRDDRPREDRPREDRPRGDRYREDRPQGERAQGERTRDERDAGAPRAERRPRRGESDREHGPEGGPATLDLAVLPPAIGMEPRDDAPAGDPPAASNDDAPAPKKRGRPRKTAPEADGPADAAA